MPVFVAMLRGVNVGGHNKIKMDALQGLCEALGFKHVKTYVQSGNVIFKTSARNASDVASRMETALEREFGFRPAVIVRSAAEMRDVIERNPFAARSGIEPAKLAVMFAASKPDEAAGKKIAALAAAGYPEEVVPGGRNVYMYFPNGMGRPKLPVAQVEKALGTAVTVRNWNTITKLLALAEDLESAVM